MCNMFENYATSYLICSHNLTITLNVLAFSPNKTKLLGTQDISKKFNLLGCREIYFLNLSISHSPYIGLATD